MTRLNRLKSFITLVVLMGALDSTMAQIPVNNLTDRAQYTDQRTFSVPPQTGYDYTKVLLNGQPIPLDDNITLNKADYYELYIERVPTGGGTLQAQLTRFIILSSNRGNPERGLIEWTPYPSIPSTADEFAGATLHVVAPAFYPLGLPIPVFAWVDDDEGQVRRANGWVSAEGFPSSSFKILRGWGSGVLPPATEAALLNYDAQLTSLSDNKEIQIEANTIWTTVSGTLSGTTTWDGDARIHVTGNITIPAGSTLTVEAGAVIKLNPLANINNDGLVEINGTLDHPVILTATNRVSPEVHTYAWGGFVMRNAGRLVANGAIMNGGGGATSFSFSPGSSHRREQPVLLVHNGSRAYLTNCAVINTAGQVGNGYNSDVTYDHCLLQKAITAGEYVGGTIIVNHSAVIEFPEENGEVDAEIADADYDGIYFTTGTHILMNSLFGFAKDDAIDSGSGGAGTVLVTNCWVESALHEALAWSGGGRTTWTYDSVLLNCGQGIECGWSDSANSPFCYADRLLSTANSVGARFGDNYDWTYNGFLNVSNSFILYNYRDIFGRNWDDWAYRVGQMDLHDNFVTSVNTNHPNNTLWNPSTDADRLIPFMTTPATAPVGIGLAVWTNLLPLASINDGLPVRLSSFTTQPVSVNYQVYGPGGSLFSGTLVFAPGETLKWIPISVSQPENYEILIVSLNGPVNGEITGISNVLFVPSAVGQQTLVPRGAVWKYLVTPPEQEPLTSWRGLGFDDGSWSSGPAELGYGDNDEATTIGYGGDPNNKYVTTYFRHGFEVANKSVYDRLDLLLKRDDGGVVYINGTEVFRSPNMPAGTITYTTRTTANGENSIDTMTLGTSTLVNGHNVVAVEIHQADAGSSDISFDLELIAHLPPPPPTLQMYLLDGRLLLVWSDAAFGLESSSDLSADQWTALPGASPVVVDFDGGQKFYRLHKP